MRIHLDTDLGGDTDDACALAMLLGWPGVELVGITTTADPGGLRAGYVGHLLDLAGRDDIPVAAGATVSLSTLESADPIIGDKRHWPPEARSRPSPPGAALDLLARNIRRGATVVAIGPLTNLALLEVLRPGTFVGVQVVAVGGWLPTRVEGLPTWGPEMDWNIAWDTKAAEIVAIRAEQLTLAPLPTMLKATLRARDLPRLRASGPLGVLLADQASAHGADFDMAAMGRSHAGLPDDLLNFQYDPVACAVAVGWTGVVIEELPLQTVLGEHLRLLPDEAARHIRVVVDLDGARFGDVWLTAVEAVHQLSS